MNKKNILFFSLLIFCATLFAQKFQIVDVEYNLEGAGLKLLGVTNPYALEQKVSVDKKTIFDDSKIESHSALTPTYKIPDKTNSGEWIYLPIDSKFPSDIYLLFKTALWYFFASFFINIASSAYATQK